MSTIKDIAKICHVSTSTVSKALNGYRDIGEETRERILKVADENGYVVLDKNHGGKKRNSYLLGVVYQDASNQGFRNEYFAHILAAFKDSASKEGYDIVLIEKNIGIKRMSYLEHSKYRSVDGICIICADYSDKEVQELVYSELPVVTIDHVFHDAISILSDNEQGMQQLAEYIVSRGHTRIAYIHGTKSSVTHNRIVSFNSVMREHNIYIPSEYYKEGIYRSVAKTEELTAQLLKLVNPPTCIVAPDDFSAIGAMNFIHKKGLCIPDDISIAGFDGISSTMLLQPNLTTVRQDTDRIGMQAAKQLVKLIESPMMTPLGTTYIKGQLIKGGSVKWLNEE